MFCGDSKKSATKKRGWWYCKSGSFFCFNCGTSMSGIKFLKALSGADYDDIHKEYVNLFLKSGLDSSLSASTWQPSIDDEPNIFNLKNAIDSSMKKPLTEKAKAYLERRMVLQAPFLKEPLYSTYPNEGSCQEYILIPWKLNGIDAYYQINDFLKIKSMKYMFPKGKKKLLYGLDNIDPTYKKIFVFEGVYDSLFVKNGIASGTKSITSYQIKLIKERWPYHEICISFDNDRSGFESMSKFIDNSRDFKYFIWFDRSTEEKDINEYVLSKKDVNMFTDTRKLDKMVFDKLQMKIWMLKNDKYNIKEDRNYFLEKAKKKLMLLPPKI